MSNNTSELPIGICVVLFVVDVIHDLGKGKYLLEVFFLSRAFEFNTRGVALESI